ncbi:MAG: hypothetical protein EZS28_042511, partial [Streblomastix strix]
MKVAQDIRATFEERETIREQCIEIVSEICQHCNKHIQYKVLIEMRFAQSLTLA